MTQTAQQYWRNEIRQCFSSRLVAVNIGVPRRSSSSEFCTEEAYDIFLYRYACCVYLFGQQQYWQILPLASPTIWPRRRVGTKGPLTIGTEIHLLVGEFPQQSSSCRSGVSNVTSSMGYHNPSQQQKICCLNPDFASTNTTC